MRQAKLTHTSGSLEGEIQITGSKSESNRMLLLQALFPEIELHNVSNSDDTQAMTAGLSSASALVDIGHAGTTMRFLTAYFSTQEKQQKTLTGSSRMQERPIGVLVDALRQLGADISYVKNEGYPPLQIKGNALTKSEVRISANISSQYITALMLIAPSLPEGLTLTLEGKTTSFPYIEMTCSLLRKIGVRAVFSGQQIQVFPQQNIAKTTHHVESDWSSASYYFSVAALAQKAKINLSTYKSDSLQGDSILMEVYQQLGVHSSIEENTLSLQGGGSVTPSLRLDLSDAPDTAQTIAVTCFGLGIACDLTGLHTLKIKETDRLVALQNELTKLGASIEITEKSLHLHKRKSNIVPNVAIDTYHDHRMAMAFAPLALLVPIVINDADVVSKSYPGFWDDLEEIGFLIGS